MKRNKRDGRPLGNDAPHYPSKIEGKVLRQLMAKSGDSKEKVLADKANRIIIAESKLPVTNRRDRLDYEIKLIKRRIANSMNLPAYAKEVLEYFNKNYTVSFWCGVRTRHWL